MTLVQPFSNCLEHGDLIPDSSVLLASLSETRSRRICRSDKFFGAQAVSVKSATFGTLFSGRTLEVGQVFNLSVPMHGQVENLS
ncbi:MAG: hypothetical protein JWM11_4638, partial [Planctomycetaceae bacterium]|nr:hypothetical protein [Planctomycetaceae bacterium]